ncbi:MAG: hypothetical protein EOM91_03305 [Sphingobacteriia bacterium]|nr:hypothetical protein [Sphingobacteriia bacterium]NCC39199.1 hypothetical protein [Gammaproteobacteria bacterium]
MTSKSDNRVLVLGVYLSTVKNHAIPISVQLEHSRDWVVDLRWAAIGDEAPPPPLADLTRLSVREPVPKFTLLNRLLADCVLDDYRFVLVIDDDVELPPSFLDRFLSVQERHGLTLCQPARTHDSYIDHYFVSRLLGVEARLTRFVEIGPVFSVSREGYDVILPFDESAPMGWGLDFVWPLQMEARGLKIGIVDASPVRHALRKPVTHYNYDQTNQSMMEFLATHSHLARQDAFVATATYPAMTAKPTASVERAPSATD